MKRFPGYIVIPFFVPAWLFAAEPSSQPCKDFILADGREHYEVCSKDLKAKNLERLSGKNVAAANWLGEDLLSRLCGQIKQVGNPSAISIGFQLAPLLDGAYAEEVYGALGESTVKNPEAFLKSLQYMLDMYKKARKEDVFKKYDFRYISAQTNLEYVDHPAREIAAMRNRKASLSKIQDSKTQEAKVYSLKILDKSISKLSKGIKLVNK